MKLKRDLVYLVLITLLSGVAAQFYYTYQWQPARQVFVYYNKDVPANRQIIRLIDNADRYVRFAIYTFTRDDIKEALLRAKARGLEVTGVVDKRQTAEIEEQRRIVAELRAAGIPLYMPNHSSIMHLKTLVTDEGYVSGSYNWTAAANSGNDEIIEIGYDPRLTDQHKKVVDTLISLYQP